MKGKIFNAQEVQAILNGSKVMFREVIKPQPLPFLNDNDYLEFLAPYQVGQKIFCKESFFANKNHNNLTSKDLPMDSLIMYAAGGGANVYGKKRPAQHMKQEHSRLTLLIKEIRVERLGEISDKDLLKEGMQITDEWTAPAGDLDFENENMDAFKNNWNATHKKPEEKFEANPWVWKVEFEVENEQH